MTRKLNNQPSDPAANSRPGQPGDAHEPVADADTTFDPAELEAGKPTTSAPGPDPFDPAALRLPQGFAAGLGVRKALLSVPIRKPDKSWFVRTHPAVGYRLQTAVIELKAERGGETYLVAPHLWPGLAGEATFSPRALFTAINRQGVLFLWPCKMPGPDGRLDEWSRTGLEAAQMAAKRWVRVVANMGLNAYEVFEATGDLPAPEWPDLPFKEVLRIAFRDRLIDTIDHPILRALRGEV
jgi:hypothetical protein